MNKPILIGITGGIGSGKSTVCKIFSSLGIAIYDADSRAKMITIKDQVLKQSIIETFGPTSYENGLLNKKFLADKVFHNPEELAKLNALIHPRVANDFSNWVSSNKNAHYLLKEAALIFETDGHKKLDKIISVYTKEKTRIERVIKRDSHRSESDVKKIIANQMDESVKQSMSDYIIDNNDAIPLIPQVLKIHQEINSINLND